MEPKEWHAARILFFILSNPLLTAALEHFPAVHEAMRLMSPSVALRLFLSLVGSALCLNVLEAISVSRG